MPLIQRRLQFIEPADKAASANVSPFLDLPDGILQSIAAHLRGFPNSIGNIKNLSLCCRKLRWIAQRELFGYICIFISSNKRARERNAFLAALPTGTIRMLSIGGSDLPDGGAILFASGLETLLRSSALAGLYKLCLLLCSHTVLHYIGLWAAHLRPRILALYEMDYRIKSAGFRNALAGWQKQLQYLELLHVYKCPIPDIATVVEQFDQLSEVRSIRVLCKACNLSDVVAHLRILPRCTYSTPGTHFNLLDLFHNLQDNSQFGRNLRRLDLFDNDAGPPGEADDDSYLILLRLILEGLPALEALDVQIGHLEIDFPTSAPRLRHLTLRIWYVTETTFDTIKSQIGLYGSQLSYFHLRLSWPMLQQRITTYAETLAHRWMRQYYCSAGCGIPYLWDEDINWSASEKKWRLAARAHMIVTEAVYHVQATEARNTLARIPHLYMQFTIPNDWAFGQKLQSTCKSGFGLWDYLISMPMTRLLRYFQAPLEPSDEDFPLNARVRDVRKYRQTLITDYWSLDRDPSGPDSLELPVLSPLTGWIGTEDED